MKRILTLVIALTLAGGLRAEPLKFTNRQAEELFGALGMLPAGLSGANISRASRAILVLRPFVESYQKGTEAAREKHGIIYGVTRIDAPEFVKYKAEVEKFAADSITVDVTRFTLSDDELDRSKPPPAAVAIILLYLEPKK